MEPVFVLIALAIFGGFAIFKTRAKAAEAKAHEASEAAALWIVSSGLLIIV